MPATNLECTKAKVSQRNFYFRINIDILQDAECLEISMIRDTRVGRYAKEPKVGIKLGC